MPNINVDPSQGRFVNTYLDVVTWKKLTVLATLSDQSLMKYVSALVIKTAAELEWDGSGNIVKKGRK